MPGNGGAEEREGESVSFLAFVLCPSAKTGPGQEAPLAGDQRCRTDGEAPLGYDGHLKTGNRNSRRRGNLARGPESALASRAAAAASALPPSLSHPEGGRFSSLQRLVGLSSVSKGEKEKEKGSEL